MSSPNSAEPEPVSNSRRRHKLSAVIAKELANGIIESDLSAGSKLPPEREMLERYGVSRGTLREALRILEVQGRLTIRSGPNGGPIVTEMTAADFNRMCSLHFNTHRITVEELWAARCEIEPMLARLATQHLDGSHRATLQQIVDLLHGEPPEGTAEYIEIGSLFHRTLASASGNRILSLFARSLGEMSAYLESGASFPETEYQKVHDDHVEIALAILAGNADLAETLTASHMRELTAVHADRYPTRFSEVLPFVI